MRLDIVFTMAYCGTCRGLVVEIPFFAPHIHNTMVLLSERMRVEVADLAPDTVKGAAIAVKEYRPWWVKLFSGL